MKHICWVFTYNYLAHVKVTDKQYWTLANSAEPYKTCPSIIKLIKQAAIFKQCFSVMNREGCNVFQ